MFVYSDLVRYSASNDAEFCPFLVRHSLGMDEQSAKTLTAQTRIRLMIEVCRAVEAAHRILIVHLDLKPSNILVTDVGQVKLLALPWTALRGVRQERVGMPATRTMQAPHCPSPQPYLVPVRSSSSRRTWRSGRSGSLLTVRVMPFMVRSTPIA